MRRFVVGCLFGMMAVSCGGDDGDDGAGSDVPIVSMPLSGKVGGESWTAGTAQTNAFLSEGEPEYWVEVYGATIAGCTNAGPEPGSRVILLVPREVGDHRVSLARAATFVIEERGAVIDNLIATKGHILVEEVTASSIRGGAFIEYDSNNSVNGRFQAAICP